MPGGGPVVRVLIEILTVDPTPDVWCVRCFLPSAVTIVYALTTARRTVIARRRECADCGRPC